ncbi:MAG: hypothetical protein DRP83_07010, partial [Planctomycetota bacterium]
FSAIVNLAGFSLSLKFPRTFWPAECSGASATGGSEFFRNFALARPAWLGWGYSALNRRA